MLSPQQAEIVARCITRKPCFASMRMPTLVQTVRSSSMNLKRPLQRARGKSGVESLGDDDSRVDEKVKLCDMTIVRDWAVP